jgi:hypothetical protein
MPMPVSRTSQRSRRRPLFRVNARGNDDLAGLGEFQRVAGQVQQDLVQAQRVARTGVRPAPACVDAQRQPLPAARWP